jgi:hypothetical protein
VQPRALPGSRMDGPPRAPVRRTILATARRRLRATLLQAPDMGGGPPVGQDPHLVAWKEASARFRAVGKESSAGSRFSTLDGFSPGISRIPGSRLGEVIAGES